MDYNNISDIPPTEEMPQEQEQVQDNQAFPEETITDEEFALTAQLIPQGDYKSSPLFYEILNYMGIDKNDDYLKARAIGEITDYVIMKQKSNSVEDVLSGIRQLEDQMQPGLEGEKREDRLRNYVRLLAKKEGLNQKFSKLLSAYERKPKVEDLSQNDRQTLREKNLSLKECNLCEQPLMVRSTRGDHLCSKCEKLKPMIARYQNYQKKGLTKAEKERILNSRTVSAGRRTYGK